MRALATALFLLSAAPLAAQNLSVTTLAGPTNGGGIADGTGAAARFSYPRGIAYDLSGVAYVADSGNHTIRRVAPDGTVTTIAGRAGDPGSNDGDALTARFRNPADVAVDNASNIYVADSGNHVIRRISPAGAVTTLAGNAGFPGASDGIGNAAYFSNPTGITVAPGGDLYVADNGNHTIRRITPDGVVSTIAGSAGIEGSANGAGAAARFDYPIDIATSPLGDLFVTDQFNQRIRKVTVAGEVSTFAGNGAQAGNDGTGTGAAFDMPAGLAFAPNGDLYVADRQNATIRRVTPDAVVTTIAGQLDNHGTSDGSAIGGATFNFPEGVAVDASGNLLIADTRNQTLRRLQTGSSQVTTFAGSAPLSGSTNGKGTAVRFRTPRGAAFDASGNLFVTDETTVRKITPAGVVTTLAHTFEGLRLDGPTGLAFGPGGELYMADSRNHVIRKILPNGTTTTFAGGLGAEGYRDGSALEARFWAPHGIAIDHRGFLFVADTGNHKIRLVFPDGSVTTYAGATAPFPLVNGHKSEASFNSPVALAFDSNRNLYISDWGNNVIRKIDPDEMVTTFAGTPSNSESGPPVDGVGSNARLSRPQGIAVDAANNLYITDTSSHVLRRITPAGEVTTVAGVADSAGNLDGTGSGARFYLPYGIAVSAAGKIAVVDAGNHNVRIAEIARPRVTRFEATPAAIPPGGTATLHWTTADADSATLDNGIGIVELSGSRIVTPATTTTYTLTVTGAGGTTSQSVTVRVSTKRRAVR